ncbi:nitroreductase family protein [Butyricicoccus sp. OF10-2]|uniref:nitroreductase family protein n=1 Tax=Butyricicoccus sp. OF10-2 TaxID=2292298 RepID=UPI002E8DD88D
MEALECIKTRRSIRKFTEQPVTEDEVRQVVEAAAFAPSWKNTQIARYIVVTDKEKKDKLADNCMLGFTYNQKTTHGAPALVVLTMIKERSGYERDGSFSTPLATHWQSFDAGIAAQTFCLSAHALGLGTVIMGIYDPAEVAKVVEIPEGQEVAALIALGHPAQDPQRRRVRMSIRCCDLSKSAYFEHRGSNSAVLFFSRHKVTRAHELPSAGSPYLGGSFFCTGKPGCANCVSVFDPDGRGVFR